MLGYKSKKEFALTYGVILGIAFIAFLVRMSKFSQFGFQFQIILFIVSFIFVSILWELLRQINITLNKQYPFERSLSNRIIIQLLLGIVIGSFVRFLLYTFGEPYLPFKPDELFMAATWVLYIMVTVGINLGFFTAYFIGRWKDSLVLAERLEKEKSVVQFDNLKNQLNPHFLFNALTSLNSLIFENPTLASQFLQQLSKVYRYVLQNKNKNFVSLQTEYDFIKNYILLLETRFQEAVSINVSIPDEMKERALVPVTLQILIENALKHNIADHEKPLKIEIFTLGDYLIVSNNLQLRKLVDTSNKQGLDNLKSLYSFLTDKPVIIEHTDTRFAVKIPLL
ncbi:MAG TPA: histidine kinase [Chryseolinea sp.]|nr:histidine kinase [Chryseolinea sp.]HPH45593.1 histidine kinase [Chryseolinea sp.]HPM30533.1 histidine kinase [Chryseolinea sp.]